MDFVKENIGWLGLGTVGLSSILIGGWRYLLGLWKYFWSFFILKFYVYNNIARRGVFVYLNKEFKKLSFGDYDIASYFSGTGRIDYVDTRKITLYRKGFRFIIGYIPENENSRLSFYTIRFFFDLKKFFNNAKNYHEKFCAENRNYYHEIVMGSAKEFNNNRPQATEDAPPRKDNSDEITELNELALFKEILVGKEHIELSGIANQMFWNKNVYEIDDKIAKWFEFKDFYIEREFPWKISFMLEGKPGTGKTSLVKFLAQKYKCNLYTFDLSTFSNREFVKEWKNKTSLGRDGYPVFILFEDFDNVFHKRENITVKNKSTFSESLTFDCLLQCMSGIDPVSGVVLFITTNNLDAVDEAIGVYSKDSHISSRPGRIDYVYNIGEMDDESRLKMIEFKLAGLDVDINKLLIETRSFSPAQVSQKCIEVGLARLKELRDSVDKKIDKD